jgi:hypothetical protein
MKKITLKAILWIVTRLWRAKFAVIVVAFNGDECKAEARCREGFWGAMTHCTHHVANCFAEQNKEAAR